MTRLWNRTHWWDRSLMAAGWVVLALGCLIWWLVRTAPGYSSSDSMLAIFIAAGVLVLVTWWRVRSRQIAPLPSAFGLATVAPLAMVPVVGAGVVESVAMPIGSPIGSASDPTTLIGLDRIGMNAYFLVWFGLIVATVAVAPFCWELTRRIAAGTGRRFARLALAACLLGALLVAVVAGRGASWWTGAIGPTEFWWVFIAVALMTPSAAAVLEETRLDVPSRGTAMMATLGYMGMGMTVSATSLALARAWWPTLGLPTLAVAATAAVLGRVAIRPLQSEADAARRERDMVISSLDVERGRLASSIHDGPLADLALLTLQLDAAGDRQGAELVRSVAGELRSLGNELRVPILDDLGAGPAIEWLASRVGERTQVQIETELSHSEDRPPAPVELAVYRIAQEAILNATKHGQGPVKVRYTSDHRAARLSVTDAGPGIPATAQEEATRSGHLGLALMARRAEAIGARLEIRSLQGGGTLVDLEWAVT